jgi:hypothetical protein
MQLYVHIHVHVQCSYHRVLIPSPPPPLSLSLSLSPSSSFPPFLLFSHSLYMYMQICRAGIPNYQFITTLTYYAHNSHTFDIACTLYVYFNVLPHNIIIIVHRSTLLNCIITIYDCSWFIETYWHSEQLL